MELNWSTFLLEIINFLVLVWILKHFFYKPVLNAIATRQAGIKQQITAAEKQHKEAESLQSQYKHRLADWENEKQRARRELHDELKIERTRLLDDIHIAIEQERQKAETREQQRLQDLAKQTEARALEQAASFVARLLSRLASPELEVHIVRLVLEDLKDLPAERLTMLRTALRETDKAVEIHSVYPLDETLGHDFKDCFDTLFGRETALVFKQDAGLLAGIRIVAGPWQLQASLKDELKHFRQWNTYEPE